MTFPEYGDAYRRLHVSSQSIHSWLYDPNPLWLQFTPLEVFSIHFGGMTCDEELF
jgi:hypothetical protein